jgi:hypothetical protein
MKLTSTLTLKLTEPQAQARTIRATVYYAQIDLKRQLANTNNISFPSTYIANF